MLRVELLLGEPYSASADLRTGRDTGSLVVHELEGDRALGRVTLVFLWAGWGNSDQGRIIFCMSQWC